jgi:hypothetical protein
MAIVDIGDVRVELKKLPIRFHTRTHVGIAGGILDRKMPGRYDSVGI